MSAIRRIRTKVFGLSQRAFGTLVGVPQGTVSRWEAGLLDPSRKHLVAIRDAASERGLSLSDSWFFDAAPEKKAGVPEASAVA